MKIAKPPKDLSGNSPTAKPFFDKKKGESFLSSKSETSFFNHSSIQPKLTIGQPNDPYEREADTVSEKVVQKLDTQPTTPTIQRKCASCEQEEHIQKMEDESMTIRKKSMEQQHSSTPKNYIQRKTEKEGHSNIENQLQQSKGSGQPMDQGTRQNMESSFGADFSKVRIHTGSNAIQMSQKIGAHAFTNQSDVYFNAGKYNPSTRDGNKLLAHELTHVLQQNGGIHRSPSVQTKVPGNTPTVQPFFDTITDSIGDFVDEVVDTVSNVAGALIDYTKYPKCSEQLKSKLQKPDQSQWLDNTALEAIRNEPKQFLSRKRKPKGDRTGATKLIKQVIQYWACHKLGRNLFPKYGRSGSFNAEASSAVRQFQLFAFLNPDGVIGPQTMAALDQFMGIKTPSEAAKKPGGTPEQGDSKFFTHANPSGKVVASIYFPTADYTLDADDRSAIEDLAKHLKGQDIEDMTFDIQGYADKRESASENEVLTFLRADFVADQLKLALDNYCVPHQTPMPNSKGEIERPQKGDTDEALKPFRRVDITVDKLTRPKHSDGCAGAPSFDLSTPPSLRFIKISNDVVPGKEKGYRKFQPTTFKSSAKIKVNDACGETTNDWEVGHHQVVRSDFRSHQYESGDFWLLPKGTYPARDAYAGDKAPFSDKHASLNSAGTDTPIGLSDTPSTSPANFKKGGRLTGVILKIRLGDWIIARKKTDAVNAPPCFLWNWGWSLDIKYVRDEKNRFKKVKNEQKIDHGPDKGRGSGGVDLSKNEANAFGFTEKFFPNE